jgi:hypothetical protein
MGVSESKSREKEGHWSLELPKWELTVSVLRAGVRYLWGSRFLSSTQLANPSLDFSKWVIPFNLSRWISISKVFFLSFIWTETLKVLVKVANGN